MAVPFSDDEPVNVAFPADAVKLPFTDRLEEMVKSDVALVDPSIDKVVNTLLPVPDIDFEAPLIVMISALAVKLPVTERFPATVNELDVDTVPLIVRSFNKIPWPVIVEAGPDN